MALAIPAAATELVGGHLGAGGAAAPAVSPSARRGRRRRKISIVTEDARGAERGRAGAPSPRARQPAQLGTPRPGAPFGGTATVSLGGPGTDTSHCPRPPRPQNNGERRPLPGDAARGADGVAGGEDALPPALLARAARNQSTSEGARRGGGGRGRAAWKGRGGGERAGPRSSWGSGASPTTLAGALPPLPRLLTFTGGGSAGRRGKMLRGDG